MNDKIYRPGQWQVVIEESGVAALPADAEAEKVVALAELLGRGEPELTEVIDVLSGGAITGLGSFAVALIGRGGTRFAVRGAVTVATGYDESFSGEDITTWSERFIAEAPHFEVQLGDSGADVEYPIRSGVVLASAVRVGEVFAPPVEAEPAAVEVPAVEDEPAAEEPAVDEPAVEEPAVDEPAVDEEPEIEESAVDESEQDAQPQEASSAETGEVPVETMAPEDIAIILAADGSADGDPQPDAPQDDPSDPGATIAPPLYTPAADPAGAEGPAAPIDFTLPPLPEGLPDAPAPVDALDLGDHDGATISIAEARRLRGATSAPDAPTEALPVFGAAAASGVARIRLSTGQVVELDRPVIIGRKPRATRSSGSSLPHLIAVESPESDISRNHLEVRPEGDSVVVIDLHTTNGSTLLRPGADPVRLHPGEQTLVLGGDVIDVGDGVTVIIEENG